VTLPAVVIPHLFVGIGEGVITVLMIEALDRMHVIPRTQEQE
jgi:ABC-type Co2+ transport system permease subunit